MFVKAMGPGRFYDVIKSPNAGIMLRWSLNALDLSSKLYDISLLIVIHLHTILPLPQSYSLIFPHPFFPSSVISPL